MRKRPPRAALRALAATIALAPLLACERPTESGPPAPVAPASAAHAYPPGTVLAVSGLPILASDVDRVADAIATCYPQYVENQCRRLALTNEVLPIWAVRARDGAARAKALEACEAARAAIEDGKPGALPNAQPCSGALGALGIDLWLAARELEPGVWSEPVELIGRWALIRVEKVHPATDGVRETFDLTVGTFPFLDLSYPGATDASKSVDDAIDAARLEIVDPEWRELVPESFQFRMRPSGES